MSNPCFVSSKPEIIAPAVEFLGAIQALLDLVCTHQCLLHASNTRQPLTKPLRLPWLLLHPEVLEKAHLRIWSGTSTYQSVKHYNNHMALHASLPSQQADLHQHSEASLA